MFECVTDPMQFSTDGTCSQVTLSRTGAHPGLDIKVKLGITRAHDSLCP